MTTPTGRIEEHDGRHVLVQTREFRAVSYTHLRAHETDS